MIRLVASTALMGFSILAILGPSRVYAGIETDSDRRTRVHASAEPGHETVIPSEQDEEKVRRATEALDHLRNKVEEWGVITISAPVAVIDASAILVPSDIRSAQDLYNDAKTDVGGTASQSTETGIGNQTGVVVTPAITGPAAIPPGGSTTSTTTTNTTNPSDVPVPNLPTPEGLGLSKDFKAPEISTPVVKSVSARLREAEDNTVKQKIYSEMTRPTEIPGHDKVVFAIVQVSCNPGWRTQQKYIADGNASIEFYDALKQAHYPRNYQRAPTVFSVLPLMDAQTIEMANSQREITQLAFQLAATLPAKGVKVNAKNLFQFVRQYAHDLKSVTPIPVVNSYSTGKTFGFRFSPSFQALRDPAQKKSRAANVLLPTTFPALITVIIHDADLHAYLNWYHLKHPEWEPTEDSGPFPPGAAIVAHVSTRWYLKERPPLWQFPKRLFTPMKRDTAAIEIDSAEDMAAMNAAKTAFHRATEGEAGVYNPVYDELHREVIDLQSKGVGQSWPIPIDNAFFETSAAQNEKVRERMEQIERQNDHIRDLTKELEVLKLQKQIDDLKKQARASDGTESPSTRPVTNETPKNTKGSKTADPASAAPAPATSTPATTEPNG